MTPDQRRANRIANLPGILRAPLTRTEFGIAGHLDEDDLDVALDVHEEGGVDALARWLVRRLGVFVCFPPPRRTTAQDLLDMEMRMRATAGPWTYPQIAIVEPV